MGGRAAFAGMIVQKIKCSINVILFFTHTHAFICQDLQHILKEVAAMPEISKGKVEEKGADAREAMKQRQIQALAILRGAGRISRSQAVARIGLEVGVSGEKAREYLRLFGAAGYCKVVHEYPDDWVVADTWKEPKKKGRPKKAGRR